MTTDYPVHNETGPPSPPGTIYPALRQGMRLDLDFRISPLTGRKVLHFPCQSISDIHWGSMFSRAKRGCMVLRDIESDTLFVVGDMMGGLEMMAKRTQHTPPYHRQALAQILEKAQARWPDGRQITRVIYPIGNHEVDAARYAKNPFELMGVTICNQAEFIDLQNDVFRVDHNHLNRYAAMGEAHEKFRKVLKKYTKIDIGPFDPQGEDSFGDKLMHMGGKFDLWLQKQPGFEKASVTLWCKREFKAALNEYMGVLARTDREIDADPRYKGNFTADTHIMGFHDTPGGKEQINDGSWCDHVQHAFVDWSNRKVLSEHHTDHMKIWMKDGNRYDIYYEDIDMPHFSEDPALHPAIHWKKKDWAKFDIGMVADDPNLAKIEYLMQADRLFRLDGFKWPAQDRANIYKRSDENLRAGQRLYEIIAEYEGNAPSWVHWDLYQAQMRAGKLEARRNGKEGHLPSSEPYNRAKAAGAFLPDLPEEFVLDQSKLHILPRLVLPEQPMEAVA